jgi:hypothetical protein
MTKHLFIARAGAILDIIKLLLSLGCLRRWLITEEFINNIDIVLERMKPCEICGGPVSYETTNTLCSFCDKFRSSLLDSKNSIESHICGCNTLDRRNCPWCKKPCHHDTSLNPKILISPMWYLVLLVSILKRNRKPTAITWVLSKNLWTFESILFLPYI